MTAFAGIISKNPNDQINDNIYNRLVSQLKSQLDKPDSESISTDFVKAKKLWLPHSRTQGMYQDKASKSWLACVGNPFCEKYQCAFGTDYTQPLLEDYLDRGADAVTCLSAPFVTVIYDGRDQSIHIVTDRVGLQHIYIAELADCYILSTSSMALASAISVHLDREAIASYFMAGYLIGQGTFFEEIRKIDGGTWTKIKSGKMTASRYWSPPSEERSDKSIDDYANELADRFNKAVSHRLDDEGQTSVELTSGIDSRLNLVCAAASGKKFHAWTIGEADSPEVTVVENLKKVQHFDHYVFSAVEDLPNSFLDDLELICKLTDGEVNCLNLISSPSCNRQSTALRDSSLSGLAGEILRGPYYLYYKGVPNISKKVNLGRMIRFKMLHNVCSNPQVFSKRFPSNYPSIIRTLINRYFVETAGQPLRWRLDSYYFAAAVQRFVGRSCSLNNYFYRQELPYFDNEIVEISFKVPHQFKRNSKLVKHALSICHPAWSDVLLENGLPARPLSLRDFNHIIRHYTRFGQKAFNRIIIGVGGKAKAKMDNAGVYNVVTENLMSEPVLKLMSPQNMASSFLYDPDNLREFVRESVDNGFRDRTQIGLILSFELLCRNVGSSLNI